MEAITNLATNPRAVTSIEYSSRYGMIPTFIANASDGPTPDIKTYFRLSQQRASVTGSGRGVDHNGNLDIPAYQAGFSWQVGAGQSLRVSIYTRSSLANNGAVLRCRVKDAAGVWIGATFASSMVNYTTPGQWVRHSLLASPTADGYLGCTTRYDQAVEWVVGSTIDATGIMITEGTALHVYADGDSENWAWSGAPNNSTSSGLVL